MGTKPNLQFIILTYLLFILGLIPSCSTDNKSKPPSLRWEKLGPGGGGSTFIPTFSYQNSDEFLIRCDMTGSYLSKNGGNSYQQINFANGASCYAFDPKDTRIIYIGSSVLNRSEDGGKTWSQIFPRKDEVKNETFQGDHAELSIKTVNSSLYPNENLKINSIRIDTDKKGTLYFSMGSYLFYTYDFGKTWKRKDFKTPIDYLYTNSTSARNEFYIFSSNTIFILNKLTKRIIKRDIPIEMLPANSFSVGTIKNSDTTLLYALHQTSTKENAFVFGHSEIWTSLDFGVNWNQVKDTSIVNKGIGKKPSLTTLVCSEFNAGTAYVVCNNYEESKKDKVLHWYGALKTKDSGKTWNWVWKGGGGSGQYGVQDAEDASNLKDAWVHSAFGSEFVQLIDVGVSPKDGNTAIVTDWYRTMKTVDGGITWNEIYSKQNPYGTYTSRGMDVTTAYGVHFDPFDTNHIAISYTDIGFHQSFNGGNSWSRSVAGVPIEWVNTCYWVVFDPDVKGKVWSVWSNMHDFPRGKMTRNPKWMNNAKGGVCVSIDGGKSWKPTVSGMGMDSPSTCIVLDPKSKPNNRTLYASVYNMGVFKSTDDGKTWSLKNNGIGKNTCAFELTLASNGNLFLIVSPTPKHLNGQKGKEFYSGEVYRSSDGAERWTKLKITDELLFPNGIGIDPNNPNRIYLSCWSNIDLSDLVGSDVVRQSGGNKRIEMSGGIFLSEDGGNTWTSIFDKNQYVYDITIDPYHQGRLYCNTFNKSAYRSDDFGKTWKRIKGYDFHWGHRIIVDNNDHDKIYITTFGSSVWHGYPEVE